MKKIERYIILIVLALGISTVSYSQSKTKDKIRLALVSGNYKSLVELFNDIVELKINGKEGSYSRTQSEFALKDFFKNHPATDFHFIHHGESKGGSKYSIGDYTSGSQKFRVYIKMKQVQRGGQKVFLIDTLDFSLED